MDTQLDFSAFIAGRTKDFTGREWVFIVDYPWLANPADESCFGIAPETP